MTRNREGHINSSILSFAVLDILVEAGAPMFDGHKKVENPLSVNLIQKSRMSLKSPKPVFDKLEYQLKQVFR